MQPSVEYLGYIHVADKDGLHATPAKIEAIVNAPKPRNVQELRSFLGLVNYVLREVHLSPLYSASTTKPLALQECYMEVKC